MQGSVGFGANIVAVPALLLIDPRLVPGPVILAVIGLNLAVLRRERHATTLRPLSWVMVGRLVGTPLGVAALARLSERGLGLVVATTVLVVVAVTARGISVPRTTPNLIAAGAVSGFSSSTAGIGGPPLAALYADAEGPEIRGSLGALFLVGNATTLIGLAIGGLLGWEEVRLGLALTPATVLGYFGSSRLVPYLDRGYSRPAILVLSSLAAVAVLVRVGFLS